MKQRTITEHTRNYLPGMLFLILILTGIDQWTKYLATQYLQRKADYILWKNIFCLHYLENRGAAFGIFQDRKWMFILLFALLFLAAIWFYKKTPHTAYYSPLFWGISFLIAGGIGNSIDRVLHSYVIDFFYFELIDFPVFNVADIYVVLGSIYLCVLFCFYYKEEDFEYISRKKIGK